MNETELRQLEKHLKLRVKTGCETCRIRRVKCDETKPACNRCTKTGRKCEGYKHVGKLRDGSPTAAASYRNSAFLVLPQKLRQSGIPRSPSRSFSPDSKENRSFQYFQTHTLPRWTEFFDSELWSRRVLQLSHSDLAIKHGILALSTLHERFENTSPNGSAKMDHFAFVQYTQAVKHSNELLAAHQSGHVNLEKVLIACIIFTCYENLAGNYLAANMHLRNGLRILRQHKRDLGSQPTAFQESIANVLYRFDLQAMTFSENTSPYDFALDTPPECPQIQKIYPNNSAARDDLVGLMRCMLWASGVVDGNPQAPEYPTWLQIYSQLQTSFAEWDAAFTNYQQNMPQHEQGDPKIYAGNTLLQMYAIMTRIIVNAGAGLRTEMAWDAFVDAFKTIVDLAETLPILRPRTSLPSSSRSSLSPSPGLSSRAPAENQMHRPIAPSPHESSTSRSSPPGASRTVFRVEPAQLPHKPSPTCKRNLSTTSPPPPSNPSPDPPSFSPSFELSPIVPLFLTASRCRDPLTRRRALSLLLQSRRREGVWDSLGAGIVAAEWLKKEEGIPDSADMPPLHNWIPFTPGCTECRHVPEARRVIDVHLGVDLVEGRVDMEFSRADGGVWRERRSLRGTGIVVGGEDDGGEWVVGFGAR